ncbi:MFS transporter [Agromyces cerinus]|uniref:Predicted arabinose efflux permease, MFS family n=1 Tax=Agromyces cerinus subsp. cerinus TaxID=232089 RepID=A0A1N6ICK8_9MICO|nr:MFS transporter [Agromyces cerinus]SIO29701.1 Predicted arabinose efflux permease, MFS family [Agromyces cerinus subsp. cerinus]
MTEPTAETPAPPSTDPEATSAAIAAGAAASAAPIAEPVTPVPAAGPLSKPYRWLSIGMFSLIFLAAFEAMAVTTIMPLVAEQLDGASLFALAFAVPLAAGIIGMVIAGNWTDRSGPIPSLLVSAALFVVGLVIAGTAVNMEVFIVGRFVHGLSGAAVIVPLYVIVGRVYPAELRARVFAGFAAAWVIPSIIGPALAGVVAETFSWHWVFLGVIALVVPAAAMMLPPVLRVRDQVQGDPSVQWSISRMGWAVLVAAAALGVSLAKELGDPWRWVVAIAAIALAAWAARPLLPPGTLRAARGMPATVLLKLIVAGAFFGSEIYLPYLFIERYEFSPSLAGAVLTGAGVSWAAASWLQGRLTRVSNTQAVVIGTILLAISLAVVFVVALFTLAPAIAFTAWTLAGGAMGFMYPRFSVAVLALSPVSAQGFNSAALTISESLGAAIALAITALVSSALGSGMFAADFAVTVAIAVVAVLLAGRVRPLGASSVAS